MQRRYYLSVPAASVVPSLLVLASGQAEPALQDVPARDNHLHPAPAAPSPATAGRDRWSACATGCGEVVNTDGPPQIQALKELHQSSQESAAQKRRVGAPRLCRSSRPLPPYHRSAECHSFGLQTIPDLHSLGTPSRLLLGTLRGMRPVAAPHRWTQALSRCHQSTPLAVPTPSTQSTGPHHAVAPPVQRSAPSRRARNTAACGMDSRGIRR